MCGVDVLIMVLNKPLAVLVDHIALAAGVSAILGSSHKSAATSSCRWEKRDSDTL